MDQGGSGSAGHTGRVLLVARESELVNQVLQLGGLVGIEVLVASDGPTARAQWREPDLVLVASGVLPELQGVSRRRDVLVLDVLDREHAGGPDSAQLWSMALAIGAEGMLALPGDDHELVRRLRDIAEGPPRQGLVVGVVGACGGAGSSTLVTGLSLAASARGDRVLAMDADPLGGGLDIHLGAEDLPGVRWLDLLRTSGRLSAATLDYALPHMNGVAVLAQTRAAGTTSIPPEAMVALLDTAVRGYDLVSVDVGRCLLAGRSRQLTSEEGDQPDVRSAVPIDVLLERVHALVLVLPNRINAVAAGMNLVHRLGTAGPRVHVVVRQRPGGLSVADISDAVGLAPTAVIADKSAVASAGERGEFTGGYLRSCRNLYLQLKATHPGFGQQ